MKMNPPGSANAFGSPPFTASKLNVRYLFATHGVSRGAICFRSFSISGSGLVFNCCLMSCARSLPTSFSTLIASASVPVMDCHIHFALRI